MKKIYFFGICYLLIFACNKSPYDRLAGGTSTSTGGTGSGTPAGTLVVFKNELAIGGAFFYPSGDHQILDLNDTSNAVSRDSIRYSWTGEDVSAPGCTPSFEHDFAGVDLMHTASFSDYETTPGLDLSKAGYSKVTFFARGTLSANTVIKVEVAGSGVPAGCPVPPHVPCVSLSSSGTADDPGYPCGIKKTLTSGWQQYSISVTPADLHNVKDLLKATYVHAGAGAGQGGTVYFDVIQYQP